MFGILKYIIYMWSFLMACLTCCLAVFKINMKEAYMHAYVLMVCTLYVWLSQSSSLVLGHWFLNLHFTCRYTVLKILIRLTLYECAYVCTLAIADCNDWYTYITDVTFYSQMPEIPSTAHIHIRNHWLTVLITVCQEHEMFFLANSYAMNNRW